MSRMEGPSAPQATTAVGLRGAVSDRERELVNELVIEIFSVR
jgi:hypothetical protein